MTLLDRLSSGRKAWIILFFLTLIAAAPGVFNLPALDRDESRFAQSSKQYLETGDYIVLRYQDEFRNKKPAGIHWLQAGSAAIFGGEDRLEIWPYRVPSWIGAALATLATFWAGLVLIGRRASFIGAALFGSTLLLTSEAHISKTDGVLVFLTSWGIGVLARLYMRDDKSRRLALLFWGIMGASFLIKGPVTPMVAAYAGLGVWVWGKLAEGKGGTWWKPLAWWPGPLLFVAMVLPWFISIQMATEGQYIQGAVGKDLKDKFAGASEGHAGWPLYHLSHIPVWFFPATLLLIPGLRASWSVLRGTGQATRGKGIDALIYGLALGALTALASWILPGELGVGAPSAYPAILVFGFWYLATRPEWQQRWPAGAAASEEVSALRLLVSWALLTTIFFELMPTRLSHYILPAYPAVSLLCGWAAIRMIDGLQAPHSRLLSAGLFALGGGLLALASSPYVAGVLREDAAGEFSTVAADIVLSQWQPMAVFPIWLWALGGLGVILATAAFIYRRWQMAVLLAVLSSVLLGWHVRIHFLPTQSWVHPTEQARLALQAVCGVPSEACDRTLIPPSRILAVGYAEPSYVMTLGTQNLHPPETPIGLPPAPLAEPVVYLFNLEDPASQPAMDRMQAEADQSGLCVITSDPVYGLNYSNGDPVHFVAVRYQNEGCD